MNQEVDLMGIVTAIAAVAGPLIAVWITRWSDNKKAIEARRMDIFRTLMRTRKLQVHYDHVGALNLIEIEFAKDAAVISAWKAYLNNLGERYPANASADDQSSFQHRRDALLTKLISEIAKVLRFKVEQLEILEGNYIPQGWHDEDWEQRLVRKSLVEVLGGRRPILIQAYHPNVGVGPYPPAPVADSSKQQETD
ncbi:MAG: hypothetical protein NXH99_12885 [Rhodobacteraceae bacterium]|nr:hypothetical protein [Paracoccaceae bacterium]